MALFNQEWRGDRIKLTDGGTVARRTTSYNGGIVYSAEPIDVNEVFQIRLDVMEMGWAGSLKFGVTVRCPVDQPVPKGILELYNREDFWVLSGDKLHHDHNEQVYSGPSLESLSRGDTVGLYVNGDGELHFLVKGSDYKVDVIEIPTDRDIFVVADIYGQVKQISIDSSVTSVVHDTVMAEAKASRKHTAAPAVPSALAAARALKSAATEAAASDSVPAEASAQSLSEQSWKTFVHQEAHNQTVLRSFDPALAKLHLQHLASLFGTHLADGTSSKAVAQEAQRLLVLYSQAVEPSGDGKAESDDAASDNDAPTGDPSDPCFGMEATG